MPPKTAKRVREITPQFTAIEKAAGEFAAAADAVEAHVDLFKKSLATLLAETTPALRRLIGVAARREAELHQLIEDNPHEFEDSKTCVLHGVKVGYTEQSGEVAFDDEATVIALVQELFPKRLLELVRTSREVNKDAVRRLTDDERALLGCRIEGAGPAPYIKREAGELDKMLDKMRNSLLKSLVGGATKDARS